jgi:23S rRNA (pseudouridine1915-N3)-methyltransferase
VKFRVLAIGKPKLRHAADGIADYQRRLTRSAEVEVQYLKEKDETNQLLDKSAGTYRIALDERGERLTTDQFVDRINSLELRGDVKTVSFLVGGSDGHPELLRRESDMVLSLSSLTLQHELALVILLEQLYRAYTIKRGEPYHR